MKKWRRIIYAGLLMALCMVCHRSYCQYSKADSSLVFSLIGKAEYFFNESNYDSALIYCAHAQAISKEKNFKRGHAFAQIEATDIYIDEDELNKAEIIATNVNKMGLQLKDSLISAVAWMQMAQIKMYSNQFDAAIVYFQKSLQYYLAAHPTKYSALAYNDLGYTWGRKGELSKQADCLIKSISIYEKYFPGKYGEIGTALSNLSTVYYALNEKETAIEYAKKSIVYKEKMGDMGRLSIGCCNLSQYYSGLNNEESEKYLRLCVKYALQSKQEERIIHSYIAAANLYASEKSLPTNWSTK